MADYKAKPLLIRAEQISLLAQYDETGEAARLRRELGIDDAERIHAGREIFGWIQYTNPDADNGKAQVSEWVLLWEDGLLSTMSDEHFKMLFEPAH